MEWTVIIAQEINQTKGVLIRALFATIFLAVLFGLPLLSGIALNS